MKVLIRIIAFFLVIVYVFLACKKDSNNSSPEPPISTANKPPIAKAGDDVTITLAYCNENRVAYLDGSGSSDPEGKVLTYVWTKISGPIGVVIVNPTLIRPRIENLLPGTYAFQLMVRDEKNLTSIDTVLLSLNGSIKEHDFDLIATGTYNYIENYTDWYCYYYNICVYQDFTEIIAKGTNSIGELTVTFTEVTDTAHNSYAAHSAITIFQDNLNTLSLIGTSSVNLKKLYQQGGGAFNGTFTITDGSAKMCDTSIYKNLAPLNVSGSFDTAAKTATVKINGKAFF
jgi:hypothetical protein